MWRDARSLRWGKKVDLKPKTWDHECTKRKHHHSRNFWWGFNPLLSISISLLHEFFLFYARLIKLSMLRILSHFFWDQGDRPPSSPSVFSLIRILMMTFKRSESVFWSFSRFGPPFFMLWWMSLQEMANSHHKSNQNPWMSQSFRTLGLRLAIFCDTIVGCDTIKENY